MLEKICCFECVRSTCALFSTAVSDFACNTYENHHCLFYEVNSLREELVLWTW